MGMMQEFRDFAVKGNVMDLAVGVIIGAAFGKIVDSLVKDIIMPLVGKIIGNVNFTEMFIQLSPPAKPIEGAATYESPKTKMLHFVAEKSGSLSKKPRLFATDFCGPKMP